MRGTGRRTRLEVAPHSIDKLYGGHHSGYRFNCFAALDQHASRNALNSKSFRNPWLVVDVDLRNANLTGQLSGRLRKNRLHHSAGTAPWRPEIDEDRRWIVDYFGSERVGRQVEDSCLRGLLHIYLGAKYREKDSSGPILNLNLLILAGELLRHDDVQRAWHHGHFDLSGWQQFAVDQERNFGIAFHFQFSKC